MNNQNDIKDLKFISKLLDSQFQGPMGIRFGVDAIIGLVPVIGDSATSVISSYIIYRAAKIGIPRIIIIKMIFNLLIDQVFGSIPVIGDLFDVAWRANSRNYDLVVKYLDNPKASLQKSYITILLIIVVAVITVSLPIFLLLILQQLFVG